VALVTGGTRGIGRATAMSLARYGATVCLTGTSRDKAELVASELLEQLSEPEDFGVEHSSSGLGSTQDPQPGLRISGIELDLADSRSIADAVKEVTNRHGPIEILVNNGAITRDGLLMRMSEDDWDAVLNVDLKGAFLLTREVIRGMLRKRWGAIINVSSVVGLTGNPGQANYCSAKAGLVGLTKSIAREYAKKGIRANVVAPGFISTDMTSKLDEEQRRSILDRVPLDRLGTPEEVASVVSFLASDAAAYITGHVIQVDGGMTM